jgi:hypothetical protein
MMKHHHLQFLERFAGIDVGDIVLLPTYQQRYEVHLGVVIPPRRSPDEREAYYYYFHFKSGDWYDNAHRVDVNWARTPVGSFRTFDVPEIGGTWIRGFGEVKGGTARIASLAKEAGLTREGPVSVQGNAG